MSNTTMCKLGTFRFASRSLTIGARPRTIGIAVNALSPNPMQTTDFYSGYVPITIEGFIRGVETQDETAIAHLFRQKANLKTEVEKDTNTLLITWEAGVTERYHVHKNENFDVVVPTDVRTTRVIPFTVVLNCLPW